MHLDPHLQIQAVLMMLLANTTFKSVFKSPLNQNIISVNPFYLQGLVHCSNVRDFSPEQPTNNGKEQSKINPPFLQLTAPNSCFSLFQSRQSCQHHYRLLRKFLSNLTHLKVFRVVKNSHADFERKIQQMLLFLLTLLQPFFFCRKLGVTLFQLSENWNTGNNVGC